MYLSASKPLTTASTSFHNVICLINGPQRTTGTNNYSSWAGAGKSRPLSRCWHLVKERVTHLKHVRLSRKLSAWLLQAKRWLNDSHQSTLKLFQNKILCHRKRRPADCGPLLLVLHCRSSVHVRSINNASTLYYVGAKFFSLDLDSFCIWVGCRLPCKTSSKSLEKPFWHTFSSSYPRSSWSNHKCWKHEF